MYLNEEDAMILDGDAEVDLSPEPSRQHAINRRRGRPALNRLADAAKNRTNGYRHSDNKIPKRVNNKPNREIESLMHDTAPALKHMPDGSGLFVGFNLPQQVTDRFEKNGFKLHFFNYGPSLHEYTGYGYRPVMVTEVPEIALCIIPIPGLFNDELREYFIYRESILMKISHENWDRYKKNWEDRMANNDRVMNDARTVRHGERRAGMIYGREGGLHL
jgi:hypothetical protein